MFRTCSFVCSCVQQASVVHLHHTILVRLWTWILSWIALMWVWVEVKPPGDCRLYSMFPFTRATHFGVMCTSMLCNGAFRFSPTAESYGALAQVGSRIVWGSFSCRSKNRYQNGTLVSGNMDQNLRSNSCWFNFDPHSFQGGFRRFGQPRGWGCEKKFCGAQIGLCFQGSFWGGLEKKRPGLGNVCLKIGTPKMAGFL